jgi:ketosteroid isomerase-like protein
MGEADRIDLDEFRLDYEALARRDWDRAQRLHHPDIEWHPLPEQPDAGV